MDTVSTLLSGLQSSNYCLNSFCILYASLTLAAYLICNGTKIPFLLYNVYHMHLMNKIFPK